MIDISSFGCMKYKCTKTRYDEEVAGRQDYDFSAQFVLHLLIDRTKTCVEESAWR